MPPPPDVMQLSLMTWPEVEARLKRGAGVMLPMGSTEQHGPMGLIGTDAICAEAFALEAAKQCDAIVAPPMTYTPAPFNTAFPGTISLDATVFETCLKQVCAGLLDQGFRGVFLVNGHGANIEPARAVADSFPKGAIHLQSWWDPPEMGQMRTEMFGDWEGMHATPSEVAVTQTLHGTKPAGRANRPPEKLSADYIRNHSGDRHGPPDEHRKAFPDGRVGSHSALATPDLGEQLLKAGAKALARDYKEFCEERHAIS